MRGSETHFISALTIAIIYTSIQRLGKGVGTQLPYVPTEKALDI